MINFSKYALSSFHAGHILQIEPLELVGFLLGPPQEHCPRMGIHSLKVVLCV